MGKEIYDMSGNFWGVAESLIVDGKQIEITFPGRNPLEINHTIVLWYGEIMYEDENRIYVDYK